MRRCYRFHMPYNPTYYQYNDGQSAEDDMNGERTFAAIMLPAAPFVWLAMSALNSSFNLSPKTSLRGVVPTLALLHAMNWLSPCSPSTYASMLFGATSAFSARTPRKRAESSEVPVPRTCDSGSPESLRAK